MKNKMKLERARLDLTQEQLAELAKIGRDKINLIENEKLIPKLDLAFRIAEALKVTVDYLFES